jgi:VanZ family protein
MRVLLHRLLLDPALRHWRLRGAAMLYLAILVMGSIPGARAEIGQLASGLVLHSIAYAVLTFLLITGLEGGRTRRAVMAVVTVALMGAIDELLQSFLPYRHGATGDWLVDCGASLVTATLLWLVWPAPARAQA